MEGIKKATSSSIWEYEFEKEPIPNKGDYNVVTDWDGNARCIIRTTAVTVLPFKEITYDLCKKEGEDDSLDSWRKNHISFFEADGKEMGSLSVSEILFLIINGIVIALFTGFKEDGEMYTFLVNNSSDRQNVRVVAYDAAGNNSTSEVKEFLVTTNLFVRWYNNKVVFYGTVILGILLIIGGSIIVIKTGKKDEDE